MNQQCTVKRGIDPDAENPALVARLALAIQRDPEVIIDEVDGPGRRLLEEEEE